TLLYGMTNITSFAIGPSWLQATMSAHFWFTMSMYAPLKLTVLYRLFLSKARDSVAPNAGMAVLMAPASFYTMAHLSSGKPGGDLTGYILFADSTVCFLLALFLLYTRRKLWIPAFHPTYAAFTFPLASTASAALLASERLPLVAGATCRAWATLLLLAALAASLTVQAGFLHLLVSLRSPRPKS
ncbi:HACE1, partial [Symbiodinium pilosum]